MRSNSPLRKTEPGAMAYEHSFGAHVGRIQASARAPERASGDDPGISPFDPERPARRTT
jgi:hypothetical protein